MIFDNQYGDRTISGTKIKLNTLNDENISDSASISHSKLNICWSKSVATINDLPTNARDGDIRLVLSDKHEYVYHSNTSEWKQETGKESYPIWLWTQDDKIYYLKSNVGIGTDSPSQSLHLHNGLMRFSNNNGYFDIGAKDNVLSIKDLVYITSDNKIGIGTFSPTSYIEVNGDIKSQSLTSPILNSGLGKIYFEENKLKLENDTISIRDSSSPIMEFSDTITVFRDMIISESANLIMDSDLLPFDATKNIGSSVEPWLNGYFENIYFGNSKISKTLDGISYSQNLSAQKFTTDNLQFSDKFLFNRDNSSLILSMTQDENSIVIRNSTEVLATINKDEFIINKNLTVKGSATYVASTNTTVSDDEFVIKKTSILSDGNAALVVSRLNGDSKLIWDDSQDRWYAQYGNDASIISTLLTLKDLDYNKTFNANIGLSVSSPTSRISIQTGNTKEIEFLGADLAEIYSTPSLSIKSKNQIILGTGDTDNITVDNLGNVGIGVTPTYKLDIVSNQSNVLRITRSGSIVDKRIEITPTTFNLYNLASLELNITAGNFGIGKVSESDKLEVNGNIKLSQSITLKDDGFKSFNLYNSSGSTEWKIGELTDKAFEIKDAQSESRIYISSQSNNIGIGTSSPYYALDVLGGASFSTSSLGGQDFMVTDTTKGSIQRVMWYEFASGRTYIGNLNGSGNYAEVYTRGSHYIDKNLGVGKEPSNFKLRVYKPNKYQSATDITTLASNNAIIIDTLYENNYYQPGIIWITTGNNETIPKAGIWTKTTDNGTKLLISTSKVQSYGLSGITLTVHPDNKIGINNENPSEALDVNGNVNAQIYKSSGTAGVSTTITYITNIQIVNGVIQKKTRIATITGGIITSVSDESGWM